MALPRFVTCLLVAIVLASSAVLSGQSLKTVIPPSMNDRWMTAIAEQYPAYADQLLKKTLFPGTHDAGAYDLTDEFAPDLAILDTLQENFTVGALLDIVLPGVKRWSLTQNGDITAQLEAGVRYFDLRLCGPFPIRICHGLYGPTLDDVMLQVGAFLAEPGRSKEIIILDFVPKGTFENAFHLEASRTIHHRLGSYLHPPTVDCYTTTATHPRCQAEKTLNDVWSSGHQVIAIYPWSDEFPSAFDKTGLWTGALKSPWPDRIHTEDLSQVVMANLACRCDSTKSPQVAASAWQFFALQIQMTPPGDYFKFVTEYVLGPSTSSLKKEAEQDNPILISRVMAQDHPNLNIVMGDFITDTNLVEAIKNTTLARLEKSSPPPTPNRAYLSRAFAPSNSIPAVVKTSWNGTYFNIDSVIRKEDSLWPAVDTALTSFQRPGGFPNRLYAGGLSVTAIDGDFFRTTRQWRFWDNLFSVDLDETSFPVYFNDQGDTNNRSANFGTMGDKFYVTWASGADRRIHLAYSLDVLSFPQNQRVTFPQRAGAAPVLASHRGTLYMAWVSPDYQSFSYARVNGNTLENIQTFDWPVRQGVAMTGYHNSLIFAWSHTTDLTLQVMAVDLGTNLSFTKVLDQDTTYAAPSLAVFKGAVYLAYTGKNGRQYTLQFTDSLDSFYRFVQEPPTPDGLAAPILARPTLHAWGDRPSVTVNNITSNGAVYTPGTLAPGNVIITFDCVAPVAGVHGFLTGTTFAQGDQVSVTVTPGPFPDPQTVTTNCVDLAGLMVSASVDNIRFASTRISPQINWPAPADIVYGTPLGSSQRNAIAVKPGTGEVIPGSYSYNYAAGAVLQGGGGQVLRVTFTPSDTLSYYSNTREVVINVLRKPATITATAAEKVYGNSDPILTGTSSGFRPEDNITPVFTRTPGQDVAGSPYTITPSLNGVPGDPQNNYDVTVVTAPFTITRRSVVVTADPKSKTYGDADPLLTYRVTTGSLVGSDAFTGSLNRAAGENAGVHAIGQGTLAINSNYNWDFTGANLTINARPLTVTADAKSKVYGNADPTLSYQITSGSLAFNDVLAGTLNRAGGENVGVHAINQGTLALSSNYSLTFAGNSLTITARSIAVTADAKSKTYGDADPQLTHQITSGSLVAGDGFTGSLSRAVGEAVGTHAINQGSLTLDNNYAMTFTGNLLTITARPIAVTADAKSKIYGTADPQLTYKVTSGNLVFSDAFTGGLSRAAGENVGLHAINQGTLTAGTNYALTYNGANLAIDAASTATALSSTPNPSTYGQTITLTATVSRTIPAVVAGTATPAGTVTFRDGAQPIGVGSLVNGIATLSIGSLGAGAHTINVDYSPAAPGNFTASNAAGTHAVDKSRTSTVLTSGLNPAATGTAVTFTASVTAVAPGAGIPTGTITFMNGSTVLGSAAVNSSGQATLTTSSLAVGKHQITATYGGDANFLSAPPAAFSQLVYAFANSAGGTFVIGDLNAAVGANVTFWGAQWHSLNALSGASAPSSFKGFAASPAQAGGAWTTGPGNSANPPASLPAYMAVIVSSSITKSGSTIGGNIGRLVVVQTNPGYGANPGHAGTGTVIASVPESR